jgi:predicted Zn-dependent protease
MLKNVFLFTLLSSLVLPLNAQETSTTTTTTQPVKLSISTDQIEEVKRIESLFIEGLGKNSADYHLEIEESDVLNAYATLGRKIILTTGIIKKLKNESALAFVIAHELGHVEQKHVLKGIFRNTIGAAIQMFFFKEQTTASTVYQGANFFHGQYYSRSKETKADLFAVELVNKYYCKVPGKLEFFELISKESTASKASEYFSTHPLPETRIQYLKTEIEKAGCVV